MIPSEILFQLALAAMIAVPVMFYALRAGRGSSSQPEAGAIAFLFDSDRLVDATRPAHALLHAGNAQLGDLDRLIDLLSDRFPALRDKMPSLAEDGRFALRPADGGAGQVVAEMTGGLMRITLNSEGGNSATDTSQTIALSSLNDEVTTLRAMVDDSPILMWREEVDGPLRWTNRAYFDLCAKRNPGSAEKWPPPRLFDDLPTPEEDSLAVITKQPLNSAPDGADPNWFEISSQRIGATVLHVATDITEQVRARDMQRDLMQTLTKTFAGLAVGLAVFDRNRQLILFNPALSELTGLNASDLIACPPIESFLDLLREQRIVPEPADYANWRQQLAQIETRADKSEHIEYWDLGDGRSFRVTLRPFPNRALALLIEDVSSDKALARALQSALQVGQDALDSVTDAVAVYSESGALMLENAAFSQLWGASDGTLASDVAKWSNLCAPSNDWHIVLTKVQTGRLADPMVFDVRRSDGQALTVTARTTATGGLCLSCIRQPKPVADTPRPSVLTIAEP